MKLIGVFQHFANATKNETWHTQMDKTNDGMDNILKEVKRKIINGRMKGRGTNKRIKKYTCGVQKEQVVFFLSVAHVNKVPGGGDSFLSS
jgi:hypothetical protein